MLPGRVPRYKSVEQGRSEDMPELTGIQALHRGAALVVKFEQGVRHIKPPDGERMFD